MKNAGLLLTVLTLALATACIQEAKWTWSGDTQSGDVAVDGVTGDGKGEVSPSDIPSGEDTDVPAPKDTTDTIEPSDTVDSLDACVPDCEDKECGDDGCGGSCGTCGDDDPCNGNELCEDGICAYDSPPDCDDGNPCTTDSCVENQGCENTPLGDKTEPACDDGNPCTENVCISGECKNPLKDLEELVVKDCLCDNDEACEPLEDDNLCNGTLVCDTEADIPTCVVDEETVVTCSLPEEVAPECNTPVCVPATGDCGVGYINEDGICDDGDACTQGDKCDQGACNSNGTVTCDDSNGCTDDTCEPLSGCVFSSNEDMCDDGEDCTWQDQCSEGMCAGIPYLCDAPGQCEIAEGAVCNGDGMCTYSSAPMDGLPCDDESACNVGEACADGACVGGEDLDCDDENPCTDDSCLPASGCVHVYNTEPCSDNDLCTTGDHCNNGNCVTTGIVDCEADEYCEAGICLSLCGNGLCIDPGEDCWSCLADCACNSELEECEQVATGDWACIGVMVEVPAGNFWMGCNNCDGSVVQDGDCAPREHPYHYVYLDTYHIDRTEVTEAQFGACESAGACTLPGTGSFSTWQEPGMGDHPINYVMWDQAGDYCTWVGKELCTEAQWEKGARGGCEENGGASNCKAESRKYPWENDTPTCNLAVMEGCGGGTQSVCSLSPAGDSPYGLCDMAGNVWEWVSDLYQKDYYCDGVAAAGDEFCTECDSWPGDPSAWISPEGPESGSFRVLRGGGFGNGFDLLRVSNRSSYEPSTISGTLGFRCCRSDCGDGICDDIGGEDCTNCIQDCGCGEGDICDGGSCVPDLCGPDCVGKECGNDGCGGSCGDCGEGEGCGPEGLCVDVSGLVWISLAGGTYAMGCSPGDLGCENDERPLHQVVVSAFDMMETEVTQAQYLAVTGEEPSSFADCSDCPVDSVGWQEARAFCEAVGGRLPSEAEWEFAARAGTTTEHYCGDEAGCIDSIAWHWDNSEESTHPVKTRAPNNFGLYDMLGNVWEWVDDWYAGDYYCHGPESTCSFYCNDCVIQPPYLESWDDPPGPSFGLVHVLRGGSWLAPQTKDPRASDRGYSEVVTYEWGFRCARDCTPSCLGKDCGDDGCGGSCGGCTLGSFCTQGACIATGSHYFNDQYQFVNDPGVAGPTTYTLWFYLEDAGISPQTLVIKKDTPGSGVGPLPVYLLIYEGKFRALIQYEGGPYNQEVGAVSVVSSHWYHVALEISDESALVYLDGILIGDVDLPGAVIDNDSHFTLGGAPIVQGFGNYLKGRLYNFRITPGYVFNGNFEPCEVDIIDGDSFLVAEDGPVPCFCVPDCDGQECGDDGCGGICGTCGLADYCDEGTCAPKCGNGLCIDVGENCETCPGDCGCVPAREECTETMTGEWTCAAKLVEIPAGSFWMGCNNCEGSTVLDSDCTEDEHPYHEVILPSYKLDRTEVTADQYAVCESAGGCTAAGTMHENCTWQKVGEGNHPINCVTWSQADQYCSWAGKRLPTEAEWEKGARGGCEYNGGSGQCKVQSRRYPWGNEAADCDLAVMSGCSDLEPVCSRSPSGDSPYGLCDMAGNVFEIVEDWYGSDTYCEGNMADTASPWTFCQECGDWPGAPGALESPSGPAVGAVHVTRGGGTVYMGAVLRVSWRGSTDPSEASFGRGFRCAQDLCIPNCADKTCGDDGCGGSCGECGDGLGCEGGVCVGSECSIPVFTDDFDAGLDAWILIGSPEPVIYPSLGNPPPSFMNNGDSSYWSGAFSEEVFDCSEGIAVRADFRLDSAPIEGCTRFNSLQVTTVDPDTVQEADSGGAVASVQYRFLGSGCTVEGPDDYGHALVRCSVTDQEGSLVTFHEEINDIAISSWHEFGIVIDAAGFVACQIDGVELGKTDSPIDISQYTAQHVYLAGKAQGPNGGALADNVQVACPGYSCQSDCDSKACGDDGCGGSCGECPETACSSGECVEGKCQVDAFYCVVEGVCVPSGTEDPFNPCQKCQPAVTQLGWSPLEDGLECGVEKRCWQGACCDYGAFCVDKDCGDDSCGDVCGECDGDDVCMDHLCCKPDCGGEKCGDDGCGGICGGCDPDLEECTESMTGEWVCAAKLVEIPPGTFSMGCNEEVDDQCEPEESPYHEVHVDTHFMDRTEVTAADYDACVSFGTCSPPAVGNYPTWQQEGKGEHPINHVTWTQAVEFCTWLGKRLPTEAEWEKAARGFDGRRYPWGNDEATCDFAVMFEDDYGCGAVGTMPVCTMSPAGDSPYGLCDMAGNVLEWVQDWYGSNYFCTGPETNVAVPWTFCESDEPWWGEPAPWANPQGPEDGTQRVIRGGSFSNESPYLRVSQRDSVWPSYTEHGVGFRCASSDCGDGICEEAAGEDCSTCIQDCGCEEEDFCSGGECVPVTEGFVPVEAGTFWMGSPAGGDEQCPTGYTGGGCDGSGAGTTVAEPGRDDDEALHAVTLTWDFEVQPHEVTQGEWKLAFAGWNPAGSAVGDDHPIEMVSWYDMLAYANWRSIQEELSPCYLFSQVHCKEGEDPPDGADVFSCLDGAHEGVEFAAVTLEGGSLKPQECEGYRLPTEAEWEYAARAGTLTAFHNGNELDDQHLYCETPFHLEEIAWYCGDNIPSGTKPAGEKQANAWGLHDVSGNIWERCWDEYCIDNIGYGEDPDGDSCASYSRVLKGGFWGQNARYCRSAARHAYNPNVRLDAIGFRLVRSLSP